MLLSALASRLDLEMTGPDVEINGVGTLEDAGPDELSFLANPKYQSQLEHTRAGAVIAAPDHAREDKSFLLSSQPYLDFARAVQIFARPQGFLSGHSEKAFIHPRASVDKQATVYPFACIGEGSHIGAGSTVFASVYIGENCSIGEDCTIYPGASIMAGTVLKNNVVVHAGVVIGSDGFGFAQDMGGMEKFPQVGRVRIEDNVEIGANTSIDRAALGETVIGRGTKIDNLVQVGHNVHIGENCIIVSQVGIAGSTRIGNGVVLAGQVGIAGHLTIGDKCRVAAKSGIGKSVPPETDMGGIPAVEHSRFLKNSVALNKLPQMLREMKRMQKELDDLKQRIYGDK
ncbi:MAG: UDP-3-O-(3-hydroxymyristoyl)glucosamine N-acyltransferase [Desulfonatronovibrionaceae bacterium]